MRPFIPVLSILAAVFTVSPNSWNRARSPFKTPAVTAPECKPKRIDKPAVSGPSVLSSSLEISVKRDNEGLEIDLLVVNDTDAILVEVKSKLTQRDVDEHLQRLAKFKRLMPRFRDVKALGAVAAMIVPDEVASYGCRQGLFVLVQSGENVIILNDAEFTPQVW